MEKGPDPFSPLFPSFPPSTTPDFPPISLLSCSPGSVVSRRSFHPVTASLVSPPAHWRIVFAIVDSSTSFFVIRGEYVDQRIHRPEHETERESRRSAKTIRSGRRGSQRGGHGDWKERRETTLPVEQLSREIGGKSVVGGKGKRGGKEGKGVRFLFPSLTRNEPDPFRLLRAEVRNIQGRVKSLMVVRAERRLGRSP